MQLVVREVPDTVHRESKMQKKNLEENVSCTGNKFQDHSVVVLGFE